MVAVGQRVLDVVAGGVQEDLRRLVPGARLDAAAFVQLAQLAQLPVDQHDGVLGQQRRQLHVARPDDVLGLGRPVNGLFYWQKKQQNFVVVA